MAELISVGRLVVAERMSGEGAVSGLAKRLGINQVRTASRERLERALTVARQESEETGVP